MPAFTISRIITSRAGIHTTTRGTIRLVFVHEGKWLVFHSGPNMYHFSSDGVHWTGEEITQFGSRNHLICGRTIYSFAPIDTDPDPEKHVMVKEAFRGTIRGETIELGEPHQVPQLTLGYYSDLQQDSTGRFTVSGRVPRFDDTGKIEWLANDTTLLSVPKGSAELSLNVDASEKLGLLFLDTEPERGKVIKFLRLLRFRENR